MIRNASLDTSFWTSATRIGIAPYLFSFFQVYYCQAVADEIIATDPMITKLIYPQAMLFRVFQEDGRVLKKEPTKPINLYGIGEANAIALALEQEWTLLINDVRPYNYAKSLGITVYSVPDFCLLLYASGKVSYRAFQTNLQKITPVTSPQLIEYITKIGIELAVQKGDINDNENDH